jgi:uncharacterized protein YjiS (DUF1127 family)
MHARAQRRYVLALPSVRWNTEPWLQRIRTRRRLTELDPRQLDDVGSSEPEGRRECAKWFWQA